MSKENCICSTMISGGDMSPRMWICPECGIGAFPSILMICKEYADDHPTRDPGDALFVAYGFLLKNYIDYKDKGEIYFCEDRFHVDLANYLYNRHE